MRIGLTALDIRTKILSKILNSKHMQKLQFIIYNVQLYLSPPLKGVGGSYGFILVVSCARQ